MFGRNFQLARLKSKLTLEDVAAATGMANPSISRIEHGRTNLTLATMKRLAAVVGLDVRELIKPLPSDQPPSPDLSKK